MATSATIFGNSLEASASASASVSVSVSASASASASNNPSSLGSSQLTSN